MMRDIIDNVIALMRVIMASTPAFANSRTVILSLFVAPIMSVLILVAVVNSLEGGDAQMTAYAAVLVTAAAGTLSGVNAAFAYERNTGVIPTVLSPRFGSPAYWLGKTLPTVGANGIVGAASLGVVFALDLERGFGFIKLALVLLAVALIVGAILGMCTGIGALLMSDPYLVANVTTAMWALMVGSVAPLSAYPMRWEVIGRQLPIAHSIGLLRGEGWASLYGEFMAMVPWLILLGVLVWFARRRLSSGADLSYL